MTEPRIYDMLDRKSAIAAFGDEAQAQNLCDSQWVIWPETAICFAELGEASIKSYFPSGGSFAWVAERPYCVNDSEHTRFVPAEVVGREGLKREIWLFVRTSSSPRFRFIGKLQSSHMQQLGRKLNHGEAHFNLRPVLTSEVWTQLGGFEPGSLDFVVIDEALAKLEHNKDTDPRLKSLETLVRFWHGEISTNDGLTEGELPEIEIPAVLRWWYSFAGRREEILSGQNWLLKPSQLSTSPEGLLVFYGENQWCYEWATTPNGDDPPVYGRESAPQAWTPEGITLSEHLILACLLEGTMSHCPYGASCPWLDSDLVDQLAEIIPPVAIKSWHWCEETRFYAKNGAFMFTMFNGESDGRMGYSVWIGAKTEHPLQFLKPLLDDSWDFIAV